MAKRILCIEDDPGMRMSIRLMLELAGYEMEEADNGRTGVELALRLLPDLIICDIVMPDLDGYETLKELHKHESTASIPFIFLTGEDPRTHRRKGMNLGANDFLTKPIDMDDFLKAVSVRLEEVEHRKKEWQRTINELSEKITRALPHELRTPMTGILGLTELLQTQVEEMNPKEIKELAQLMFDSAVRMNQTLEKFWIHTQCLLLPNDHEKLSASRQIGSHEAHQVVQHVAEELATSYNRSNDLSFSLSPISVAISERYLEQVLHQVIDNAFKFSITGTKVIISTVRENAKGLITITDSGRGMSEDQTKKIQMFMQFDRERYEQQGLGLGLMITKRLTEIHGGNFQVFSSPGKGTTISLTFPLIQKEP
jgi:signal transduction histidine kinase